MNKNLINYFFLTLIAILPISFVIGPAISLINVLIFDLSFLALLLSKKNFDWIKAPIIKILIFFYIYLIFNSLISLDYNSNLFRNFGFIRLIILFIGLNYFFKDKNFSKVLFFWSFIIFIIIFDIFFERIFGNNTLGFSSGNQRRIVSFFKDEMIVGGYVYAFLFIIIGFYFELYKSKNLWIKSFLFLGITVSFLSILITGERSNTIRFFLSLLIFLSLVDFLDLKKKFLILISIVIIFTTVLAKNEYLKTRMYDSLLYSSLNFVSSFKHGLPWDNPQGNLYAKLYRSGYDIYKKYPLFGVGNKNYRIESCDNNYYQANIHIFRNDYVCMTHPHQIYFELLSEHGLVGTLIILSLFFLIFFNSLNRIILEKNYITYGSLSYLLIVFTPILPSGAFFTDYNISLLFLNLSIMYASSKKLNIFNYNK